jgi:hypothetical protein
VNSKFIGSIFAAYLMFIYLFIIKLFVCFFVCLFSIEPVDCLSVANIGHITYVSV